MVQKNQLGINSKNMQKPDYSNYTIRDLYDALSSIDKQEYPDRYQLLKNEIQQREGILSEFETKREEKVDFLTWAKGVGIAAFVLAILIIISNLFTFFLADTIDKQQRAMVKAHENGHFAEVADLIPEIPDWYNSWRKAKSGSAVIIGVGLLLISIGFLKTKPNFDRYLVIILCMSILLYGIDLYLVPVSDSMSLPNYIWSVAWSFIWGNAIEFALLGLVLNMDRAPFRVLNSKEP